MNKEELRKSIEKYVEDWMNGHEEDTFIKNEYGVYLYSAGPTSLNLKIYFETLLEDFIEDILPEDQFINKATLNHTNENYWEGMGYSGVTEGILVKGQLIEKDPITDYAIIICEKNKIPCAVIYRTLKKI